MDELSFDDAEFIVELLNDKSFLHFVGDKDVRTIADAHEYLRNGPMESYLRHRFGLYLVRRVSDGTRIGICGILRRDGLDHPDIGFALLPDFRGCGCGYGYEAVVAMLVYARNELGLRHILGITDTDNHRSIRLLEKLGFGFERRIRLVADAAEISLYSIDV